MIRHPSLAGLREREFAALGAAAYLNAASVGPLPERARRAGAAYDERRAAVHTMRGVDFEPTLAACRTAAARLIGARPDEIALGGNTSFGIGLAALSLPVDGRRRVVVSDREFPANVYPWLARERDGYRVEIVPTTAAGHPDEQRLLERIAHDDVGIFALSAVQFATGYRADLARLGRECRERGVYFVVDAIQAVGHLPIDVRAMQIDVLATGAHKWLCGPFGTGFAYVRRELIGQMEPRVVGWTGLTASLDLESVLDYRLEFVADARRWEFATLPLRELAALTGSLELIGEAGVDEVERHVLRLLDPLIAWIEAHPRLQLASDLSAGRRSGIVAFRHPQPQRVLAAFRAAGVHGALREGLIRIAPHLYNTSDDIDRVIEALQTVEER